MASGIVRLMCILCASNYRMTGKEFCAKCQLERELMHRLFRQRRARQSAEFAATAKRNRRMLNALNEPEKAKPNLDHEVSYIASIGFRVTERHSAETAYKKFETLKSRNVCGLRLSVKDDGRIMLLDSHDGSFRPVVTAAY